MYFQWNCTAALSKSKVTRFFQIFSYFIEILLNSSISSELLRYYLWRHRARSVSVVRICSSLRRQRHQTFKHYWLHLWLESLGFLSSFISVFFLFFAVTNFEVLNNSLHDLWWLALLLYKDSRHPQIKYLNSFQLALHGHSFILWATSLYKL